MTIDRFLQVLPLGSASRPDPAGSRSVEAGTVAIETHGCKLNQADSAVLAQEFARVGYRLVEIRHDADIIVVNTCTVTATADSKARQALRAAHRANPEAVIVAAGCYPERAEEDLRRIPEVCVVVGNRSKPDLVAMAVSERDRRRGATAAAATRHDDPGPAGILRRSRAMVKIQEGCDQVCAYCIVPKVRGRERSIPPAQIVDAVRTICGRRGFKEVTLTGTQLGTYGFDIEGVDLARVCSTEYWEKRTSSASAFRRCKRMKSAQNCWLGGTTGACARTSMCLCKVAAITCSKLCAADTTPTGSAEPSHLSGSACPTPPSLRT